MSSSKSRSIRPRDLAAAIDVSESSLKRWADEGILAVTRTAGGHRRIAIPEAIRFVRAQKLMVVDGAPLGFKGLASGPALSRPLYAEGLEALFREQRGRDASQLLLSAYLAGASVAELCDGPIRGSLDRVGEAYRHQTDGIAIEHAAVDACIQALHTIRGTLRPESDAPTATGGAAPTDPYILPSLAVSVVLEDIGYRAINLGPDTPLAAVRTAAEQHGACLLWRSYSVELSERVRRSEVSGLRELGESGALDLVVGGRCSPTAKELGPRVFPLSSLADLARLAKEASSADSRATPPQRASTG